jgi:hypothetical protein
MEGVVKKYSGLALAVLGLVSLNSCYHMLNDLEKSNTRPAPTQRGLALEINSLSDPDYHVDGQESIGLFYVNEDNLLVGKYILDFINRRLKARGFSSSRESDEVKKADLVMTVWASEKPFSFWTPGYNYFVPVYQPGAKTDIVGAYGQQVGSLQSAGTWNAQAVTVPGKEVFSNSRFIKIQVYQTKRLRSGDRTPIWEGTVSSAGELRLDEVYEALAGELSDEFPKGTGLPTKRTIPLD